jgi:hypothetical protein
MDSIKKTEIKNRINSTLISLWKISRLIGFRNYALDTDKRGLNRYIILLGAMTKA